MTLSNFAPDKSATVETLNHNAPSLSRLSVAVTTRREFEMGLA
jgi:hypothetical protein